MVYELYVDTLFGVNFVMNLYLLMLVNLGCMRTATRMRILAGAGVGAIAYTTAFFIPVGTGMKWPVMLLGGAGLMLWITFRPGNFRGFFKLLGQLAAYTFLMGGLLLFLGNALPAFQSWLTKGSGVLGMGTVIFLLLGYAKERELRKNAASECSVRLYGESGTVTTTALVDSGNSLTEPVSGKPVAVIGQELFRELWPEPPAFYRVIPYRSVGKAHGLLKGYQVPELEVEICGVRKRFSEVWVAVSEEPVAGVILNPRMLSGRAERSSKAFFPQRGFQKRKERVD